MHHRVDISKRATDEPAAFVRPDYPCESIMIIEGDDSCGDTREPACGSTVVEGLASHLELCECYAVDAFSLGSTWTQHPDALYREEFIRLLQERTGSCIRYITFTLGGPVVEQEMNEGFTRSFCQVIRDLLTRLPERVAVLRIPGPGQTKHGYTRQARSTGPGHS